MYLMGTLDDADIEWLGANGATQRLAAGQVLVREGEPIHSLFVVLDGELAVKAGTAQVATLYAGEVVGEISFVDSRPPLSTVIALAAARVLEINGGVLRAKLGADLRFASNFYRALAIFLADRLRATTGRLGYGQPSQDAAQPAGEEMSEMLIETASLGAQRFDNLLRGAAISDARRRA
jgi:CRP-like cAMP-binding protein